MSPCLASINPRAIDFQNVCRTRPRNSRARTHIASSRANFQNASRKLHERCISRKVQATLIFACALRRRVVSRRVVRTAVAQRHDVSPTIARNNLLLMDGAENPIGRDNRIVGPIGGNLPQPLAGSIFAFLLLSFFLFFLPCQRAHHRSDGNGRPFLKTKLPRREFHSDESTRQSVRQTDQHRRYEEGGRKRKSEREGEERDHLAMNSSAVGSH